MPRAGRPRRRAASATRRHWCWSGSTSRWRGSPRPICCGLNAATILSAYVGRNSGDQILNGKIHRGDGEEIEAAILFTDIVGFTALSNTMAGPEIVSMLNDAFDLMVPPVEAMAARS